MNRSVSALPWAATLAILLVGCPAPLKDGHKMVGWMEIYGPNASVNGSAVTAAQRIFDGDKVATGAGTSVKISITDGGGYIQFDEDTDDPNFILEARCLLLKLFHGQVFIKAHHVCVEDPNVRVALNSEINLLTLPRKADTGETPEVSSTLTVLEGSVEISRPTQATLGMNQQFVVSAGKAQTLNLPPERARASAAWINKYVPTAAAPPPSWLGPLLESMLGPRPTPTETPAGPTPPGKTPASVAPSSGPKSPGQAPPPQHGDTFIGWCCETNTTVDRRTRAQCDERKGRFFTSAQAAQTSCRIN